MKVITFSLCLLVSVYTFASDKSSMKFNDEIIKYTAIDKKIARRFYQVWRELKKTSNKYQELSLLKKELKSSEIFTGLIPLVNHHYQLIKIKRPKEFKHLCLKKSKETYTKHIEIAYQNKLEFFCQHKFLEVFTKRRFNKKNDFIITEFLELNLDQFLTKKFKKRFLVFLKRSSKNKKLIPKISKIFHQYYLRVNTIPKKAHITLLDNKSKFNSFFKNNKSIVRSNSSAYRRKLRSKSKKIVSLQKNNKEIKKSIIEIISYAIHNKHNIGKKYARKKILGLALSLDTSTNQSHYKHLLKTATKLSNPSQLDDIKFYHLLSSLIKSNYIEALKVVKDLDLLENFHSIQSSKLKYWIAKIYEENSDIQISIKLYTDLIRTHPLSFYSIISIKHLNKMGHHKLTLDLLKPYKSNNTGFNFNSNIYRKDFLYNMKRLHVWLDLEFEEFVTFEYKNLLDFNYSKIYKKRSLASNFDKKESEKHIFYLILKTFHKKRKYLYSFKFIYQKLSNNTYKVNSDIMDFLFPLQYWKMVKRKSKKINPILVLSLIRQESAFNPKARSPVGAQGLMQIMLPTARQYGKRISRKQLSNPNFNIKIGVKYLKRLIKKFDNNLIFTLAAYNAGETVVRRWRRNINFSQNPIVAIEQIPYKETRNYVKLIYRNIFFYQKKENKNNPKKSLDESFKISYL